VYGANPRFWIRTLIPSVTQPLTLSQAGDFRLSSHVNTLYGTARRPFCEVTVRFSQAHFIPFQVLQSLLVTLRACRAGLGFFASNTTSAILLRSREHERDFRPEAVLAVIFSTFGQQCVGSLDRATEFLRSERVSHGSSYYMTPPQIPHAHARATDVLLTPVRLDWLICKVRPTFKAPFSRLQRPRGIAVPIIQPTEDCHPAPRLDSEVGHSPKCL
jgi:hypothetical protein